ncbi:DUF6973 domain-containing protein [Kaistella yonginensis]|uniref:DUF6973 domain-containing protein n=1 Tax=Kaistella yonginensis TaxID=658267 RepID=UPI0025B2BA08|nr:hypothetical protein [Kaistella yonginensis]MDN3606001.1 hypothetical protein [Kaistella yonginensis]
MRNIKIIFNALRSLSFTKIMKLLRLTLPHPLFSILGLYATVRSFSLAQKHFPKTHSNDGVGNAFRHSLWTCLIMMYCCKISSPKKSLDYCKKMTDLHEELFPNKPLQTKMDLHNNQVGMDYFMSLLPGVHRQFFETSFFVKDLIDKTKTAKILKSLDDDFSGELVYLK